MIKKLTDEGLLQKVHTLQQTISDLKGEAGKFKMIFENANDQITYIDKEGQIIDVNNKVEDIFGYTRGELIGKKFRELDILGQEDLAVVDKLIKNILSGQSVPTKVFKAFRKNSSTVFIEVTARQIEEDGKVKGILSIIRDITKRKRIEFELERHRNHLEERVKDRTDELMHANQKLNREITNREKIEKQQRESEEKLRNVIENSVDVIYRLNLKTGIYDYISPSAKQVFGYDMKELTAMGFKNGRSLIHPDDLDKLKEYFDAFSGHSLEKMSPTIECRLKHKTLGYRWMSDRRSVVYGANNTPIAVIGNVRDVTGQKTAEKILRENRDYLDELVDKRTAKLEETNIALKVLLDKREEDKEELEQKILLNVKEMIIPYLKKLQSEHLSERQKTVLNILGSNIEEIISPFSTKLSNRYFGLTPAELQTGNLVKQGKTTKEIAELLHSSIRAVEFHRSNIRKKLGIKNTKDNLRSHLLSFD